MAPPLKTAKTALENKTGNTHTPDDTVTILFDLPFAAGDNPAHETFELSWVSKTGSGKKSKTRATTEPVDTTTLKSWTGDVLWTGHVAIRLEEIKSGIYKLTRSDGRKEPEVIFSNLVKEGATPHAALTGKATDRRDQPHKYWTWLEDYHEAKDKDLKGKPPDFTTLPVPEPRKAK